MLLACAIALPQAIARSSESGPRDAATARADVAVPLAAAEGSSLRPAPARVEAGSTVAAALARRAGGEPAGGVAVNVAFTRGGGTADRRLFHRVAAKASRLLARRAAARAALPPLVVRRVIAAGNRIASAPYTYGGGHGNWDSGGYDCSGSVSYALHGGALLDTALASGAFMSWGEPGPGRWITIYANGGHAFMVVAGPALRHDRPRGDRLALAGRDARHVGLHGAPPARPVSGRATPTRRCPS